MKFVVQFRLGGAGNGKLGSVFGEVSDGAGHGVVFMVLISNWFTTF